MSIVIQNRLDVERNKEQALHKKMHELEQELSSVREELLRQQGAVKMLESLLEPSVDSGVNSLHSSPTTLLNLDASNARAKRSTKDEMRNRRRIVARVLFEMGSCTANEMLDQVNAELDDKMKIHHLRNVLKKFTSDFEKGDEHGVWELSSVLREKLQSEGFDQYEFSEDSDTE